MTNMFPLKLFVLVWLIVVLAIASIAAKEKDSQPADLQLAQHAETDRAGHQVKASTSTDSWSRLREGSKITDQLGEFQVTADRFNFYLQNDKHAIRVLENLSLERIARTLEDDPSPRTWSVTGVLTEFRGENYLLITRAVLKPRQIPATRTPDNKKDPEAKSNAK